MSDFPYREVPAINTLQLGGIETSVLDNGPGRGVRIAWVKAGGLRYKVVLDRGMDIADAEFLGQSLTWLSFGGTVAPSPAYGRGYEWLRSFGGGLLVSAGPLNVGEPFTENGHEYGLHGSHSNTPAEVESIVNPEPAADRMEMRITGRVRTARVFGSNVELHRTISSRLGVPAIQIEDRFVNRGNTPAPLAWLLHINFGYPLLEPGAGTFCYPGPVTPAFNSDEWLRTHPDFRAAPEPQKAHRGAGEVVFWVDRPEDRDGNVLIGVVNRKRKFGVKIEYSNRDYPRLANWQHWGPGGSYVGALEPMTAGLEGHAADRTRGWYEELQPGEERRLVCRLTATDDPAELETLLALNG